MRLLRLTPIATALFAGALLSTPSAAEPTRASAGVVRADTLWSQALGTHKQFIVWLPPSYATDASRRYPVAYYLHGAWGDEWDWVKQGKIDQVLDSLTSGGLREMIVVMPDGDDGFYTTWNGLVTYADCAKTPPQRERAETYCVPWPHYDDYIAHDLVARVDSAYRTIPNAKHRGIAGLSMGGYGAISLALRYPDVFSAAASHSGLVSPTYLGPHPFAGTAQYATTEEEMAKSYGSMAAFIMRPFGKDSAAWAARDPMHMAERLLASDRAKMPAIKMDCGASDGLVDQNRALDAELTRLGIAHTYAEYPGAHTWEYWNAHVRESLRFISDHIAEPSGESRP